MSRQWLYLIICLVATTVFFLSNENLKGYLRCDSCLGKEIHSPPDSLYNYELSNKAPFKYRILFPTIVKVSHALVFDRFDNIGFYYTYKFWSWFFYVSSACLLFYLMTFAGFSDGHCLTGAFIFILLPPMLMAYTLPVHTREDPLAYSILFIGLMALLKDKKILFVVISVVGVLCRETLLLLPMLYFFFSDDKNILRRLVIPAIPSIAWLTLRLSMKHAEYDVEEGFKWNNNNIEQVFGFLFITFNVLWIPFIFHVINLKNRLQTTNKVRQFFYRTSLLTLITILLTTYFGGIYNEIRLLYLLAPWMILITLDFVEQYGDRMKVLVLTKKYLLYIFLITVVCVVITLFTLKYQPRLIVPGKYRVPYHLWIIISMIYIYITLIFVPVSFKVRGSKRI